MYQLLYMYMFVFTEELSGIFVRSIADGSAAALDGRIQINDQIIAVSSAHTLLYP